MDEIMTFIKNQKSVIKSNDYFEFFLNAYNDLNTDQVKYIQDTIFPKALNRKPLEQKEELSRKIMTGLVEVTDYVLTMAIEDWKENEEAEEMSIGAFIESHIHNFLGMGQAFWRTRLRANEKEFDILLRPDNYGIEIIKVKD